jgi:hypothetical protein
METEEPTITTGPIAVDRESRRTLHPRSRRKSHGQRSNAVPADSAAITLEPVEKGSEPRVATQLDRQVLADQPERRSAVNDGLESGTGSRRGGLLHSESVRAGLAAVGALVGAVVVVATLHAMDIAESPTVVTVLVLPVFVYGVVSGRLHELTGPGGWRATFDEVKREQELQASDIESIRVALRGLVSKYELQHLQGLATKNPFIVNYGKEFYNELKRLDDFGFLLPHPGLERGLYTVCERFGHEENSPRLKTGQGSIFMIMSS